MFSASGKAEVIRPHIKVDIVSDYTQAKEGERVRVGFLATPDPGWHIYWKHPGDSGRAPSLNWTSTAGALLSESRWPTPKEIPVGPLVNYGYDEPTIIYHDLVMPAHDLNFSLKANWLVCEENCVPGEAELTYKLPHAKESVKSDNFKAFDEAALSLPKETKLFQVDQARKGNSMVLTIHNPSKAPLPTKEIKFLANSKRQIDHAANQKLTNAGDGIILEVPLSVSAPKELSQISGILISKEGFDDSPSILVGQDTEITTVQYDTSKKAIPWQSMLGALWFALLGGLLLNIMPCVFPVLSIKILNLVQDSDEAHRRYGNFYAIGVILSFALIGIVFLALRAFGASYGWGFQLQYPPFVFALVILLLLVALNLIGLFEIGASIQKRAGTISCSANARGAFLSGVLATVVATPCTAPFMGVALAAAVSVPLLVGFLIFIFLGIGLALPFFVISYIPSISKYFPRPGKWMEVAKQAFSFPIFGTIIWLLWVYGKQTDIDNLTRLLATLLGVSTAAWIYGLSKLPTREASKRRLGVLVSVLIFCLSIWVGIPTQSSGHVASNNVYRDSHDLEWLPYSKELVQKLQDEGKIMYLDFTASWCITCQVNKTIVFSSEEVRRTIRERHVVLIRGDWTSEDPLITEALRFYGAEGVPLNIVYHADKSKAPTILPSLLTPSIVLNALKE